MTMTREDVARMIAAAGEEVRAGWMPKPKGAYLSTLVTEDKPPLTTTAVASYLHFYSWLWSRPTPPDEAARIEEQLREDSQTAFARMDWGIRDAVLTVCLLAEQMMALPGGEVDAVRRILLDAIHPGTYPELEGPILGIEGTGGSPPDAADGARARVELLLQQMLGVDTLAANAAGEWSIRWGSAIYFVRVARPEGGPLIVQVYSPLLGSVEGSAELFETINGINGEILDARVWWADRTVWAAAELLTETLDLEELQRTCGNIARLADAWNDVLHQRFGGELAFPAEGERQDAGSGSPTSVTKQQAAEQLAESIHSAAGVQKILFGA